ncbi:flagellar biosynthesis protein FlhF [Bacillus shivajii]|uniref:flagellar biosynthesis protein FlhF n=1 Tax=Bacillus shivajii TaxID=1983719 RepID=UPI001CF974EA|nr:flagellar biosynthesis protein FlhF [Bacillus shivajii]UCZ51709.1 flagellar biosynthesis protein FlhF [Bacillus shivajii]
MKVKKYVAKDMPEAMEKIRQELGNDAVILNSKRIETGGFLGFFTKKNIEVIAAIDPDTQPKKKIVRQGQEVKKQNTPRRENPVDNKENLKTEIDEIKKMIANMNRTQSSPSEEYPEGLSSINDFLIDQEMKEDIRLQIMKNLLKRWYKEEGETKEEKELLSWTYEELDSLLNGISFGGVSYNKKFLNLVGPTGVGKTTTVAKIAAKAAIKDGKKIAFITTDTYRIAAIEQLKTYAKILNAPVEVAYSIDDFQKAKERLKDYDFILVDSAGRNFRNSLYVKQLNEVIDFNDEMETHLVLSLASKYRDMEKIIEQFNLIKIDKVIFTKADETDSVGAMVNVHLASGIGSSYITTGQNVPDDISESTKEMVLNEVLRRKKV